MSKLIDLTNQRFGRLVVLYHDTNRPPNGGSYWICQCDCGKIKSVKSSSLRRGDIVSWGCYRTEQIMKSKERNGTIDNLIGQRFGKLLVLSKNPTRVNGAVYWDCLCDCGSKITVSGQSLKRKDGNQTVSCGCFHRSIGAENVFNSLKQNNINFKQEYSFNDLPKSRFDFAILENEKIVRLVEFDGEQHFKDIPSWGGIELQRKRDKIKNEYALSHNIPLVRIPYWERDSISLEIIMGDKFLVKDQFNETT